MRKNEKFDNPGIKNKRPLAAWDTDYLAKFLFGVTWHSIALIRRGTAGDGHTDQQSARAVSTAPVVLWGTSRTPGGSMGLRTRLLAHELASWVHLAFAPGEFLPSSLFRRQALRVTAAGEKRHGGNTKGVVTSEAILPGGGRSVRSLDEVLRNEG